MGDCRIRILISRNLLMTLLSGSNGDGDEVDETSGSTGNTGSSTIRNSITAILNNNSNNSSSWYEILNKLFSSDTTIREVCEDDDDTSCPTNIISILEQQQQQHHHRKGDDYCKLWDCTNHPPKDITDWPLHQYKNVQGLYSKTLYDAGWFPSGTLRLSLSSDGIPLASSISLQNDDVQYNAATKATTSNNNNNNNVQLVGEASSNTLLLPSQVLDSVAKRFDNDNNDDHTDSFTQQEQFILRKRKQKQKLKQQKEQERFHKLEARIRKLDALVVDDINNGNDDSSNNNNNNNNEKSNKKTPVSDQVRRMLIKSRATGSKTLKQQDRVYFHIVVMECTTTTTNTNDDENDNDNDGADNDSKDKTSTREEFRFFSIQDTIGKGILSTFQPTIINNNNNNKFYNLQSEFLIHCPIATSNNNNNSSDNASNITTLRRLPNTMRVYEAISQKYLEPQVNKVVIRWFDPSLGEEPTTSILDKNVIQEYKPDTSTEKVGIGNDKREMNKEQNEIEGKESEKYKTTLPPAPPPPPPPPKKSDGSTSSTDLIVGEDVKQVFSLIQKMDEEQKKGKKRSSSKSSTSAGKVKQMLIKTRAKGDAKRIKNVQDRFFFELITVIMSSNPTGDDNNCVCESSYCFLSWTDPLGRILRDCIRSPPKKIASEDNVVLMVPLPTKQDGADTEIMPSFRRLTNLDMSFREAETEKLLQPFDRLIIHFS